MFNKKDIIKKALETAVTGLDKMEQELVIVEDSINEVRNEATLSKEHYKLLRAAEKKAKEQQMAVKIIKGAIDSPIVKMFL